MSTSYSWKDKGRYGSFRLWIERVGVQVKLWDPLRTRAIPERFWGGDSQRVTISSVRTFTFTLASYSPLIYDCVSDGVGGVYRNSVADDIPAVPAHSSLQDRSGCA